MQQAHEFKVTLVGPTQSGKSTFLSSVLNSSTTKRTLGVDVRPFNIDPRHRIVFWDTAGDPRFAGLGAASYATGSDLVVAFGGKRPDWTNNYLMVDPHESNVRLLQRIAIRLNIPTQSKL